MDNPLSVTHHEIKKTSNNKHSQRDIHDSQANQSTTARDGEQANQSTTARDSDQANQSTTARDYVKAFYEYIKIKCCLGGTTADAPPLPSITFHGLVVDQPQSEPQPDSSAPGLQGSQHPVDSHSGPAGIGSSERSADAGILSAQENTTRLEKVKELNTSIEKLFDILSTVNNPKTKKLKSTFETIKKEAINHLEREKKLKAIKIELEKIFHMETERLLNDLKGRNIRCVLFDLGDTLWTARDDAAVHQIVTQRGIDFLNKHLEPQNRLEVTTESYQRLKAAIDAIDHKLLETIYHTTLDTTASPSQTAAVQDALEELKLPRLDHTICSGLLEALRISRTDKRVLFDDTHSTLKELQRRGFIIGVVTNRKESGQAFENDLRKMGISQYFDTSYIGNSASLKLKKPDPEIFLFILNVLGVKPEETVMVGNSLHTDISGAQKAGVSTIWRPMNKDRAELQKELGPGGDDYLALLDKTRTREGEHYRKKGIMETNLVLPDAMIKDTSDILSILQKTAGQ